MRRHDAMRKESCRAYFVRSGEILCTINVWGCLLPRVKSCVDPWPHIECNLECNAVSVVLCFWSATWAIRPAYSPPAYAIYGSASLVAFGGSWSVIVRSK